MNIHFKHRTDGYTLVEVLLSVSILSFLLLCAYGVLEAGNTITVKGNALMTAQQQARNTMDRIVREVRGSSTLAIAVLGANSDKVTVTIPTATGLMYYLSGTTLVREYPVNTKVNVANSIGRLKFTLSGTLLQIDVRADVSTYGQTISFPLTQKVRLRNE